MWIITEQLNILTIMSTFILYQSIMCKSVDRGIGCLRHAKFLQRCKAQYSKMKTSYEFNIDNENR